MKLQSACYLFLIGALQVEAAGASSLRSRKVSYDFSKLKCTFEAWSSQEKCSDSLNKEGEACSYCIIKDNGQEAGLCVDPEIAPTMEQMNPEVTCSTSHESVTDENLEVPDFHDFKCSIEAFTDPEKCALTKTDDGKEWCQYCSMDGPLQQGLCVSPEHAKHLEKIGAPALRCEPHHSINKEDSAAVDAVKSSPIADCNLHGIDLDTCLDPTKVNGSDCVWCDAGIGGFCLPQSWKSTAGRFLTCQEREDETSIVEEEEPVETGYDISTLDLDPSTFDSSCIKKGMSAASPDDCRNLIEDESGENCIFCKSPTFGGIGLCMPPAYKGKKGRFYECDAEGGFVEEE